MASGSPSALSYKRGGPSRIKRPRHTAYSGIGFWRLFRRFPARISRAYGALMPLKTWRGLILPALLLLAIPAWSPAQVSVSISVNLPPPELPVYDQPPIPGDGYLWTPGFWAWSDEVQDFYWVPGTWVLAPQPGYLWTPRYWGAFGALFRWHPGYWGPRVGFYGGVDY